jgi:ribose transport system substrate-binding protein
MTPARSLKRICLGGALAATLALAVACGSSGGSTAASGSTASAVSDDPVVLAAKSAYQAATTATTKILQTTPLKTKPATGKTVYWLDCGSPGCKVIYDDMRAATGTVGWNVKRLSYNLADPSTLVQAMDTALADKPVAVAFSGVPVQVWQGEIAKFEAAGVAIIPSSAGAVPIGKAIPAVVYGPNDNAKGGEILADWFISQSGGKGSALLVNYPDVGSFAPSVKAFKDTVAKCSGCKVTQLNLTLAQLASGTTPAVVSALRRDNSITYVADLYGEALQGFPAAAQAAGLSNIKIAGLNPSIDQLQGLSTGDFTAWLSLVSYGIAWNTVDVALRFSEGMSVPAEDGGIPVILLTKDNICTASEASSQVPTDLPAQFKKLWLVG